MVIVMGISIGTSKIKFTIFWNGNSFANKKLREKRFVKFYRRRIA
jgi:hypothetical protein